MTSCLGVDALWVKGCWAARLGSRIRVSETNARAQKKQAKRATAKAKKNEWDEQKQAEVAEEESGCRRNAYAQVEGAQSRKKGAAMSEPKTAWASDERKRREEGSEEGRTEMSLPFLSSS
jgi:hypothetical protein